jgi:hypothetical protein
LEKEYDSDIVSRMVDGTEYKVGHIKDTIVNRKKGTKKTLKRYLNAFEKKSKPILQTNPNVKSSTTTKTNKGFKINPKYALGALGASAVIGGGYLGYRALTNKDKKRK